MMMMIGMQVISLGPVGGATAIGTAMPPIIDSSEYALPKCKECKKFFFFFTENEFIKKYFRCT
jgi:hypothetical protein